MQAAMVVTFSNPVVGREAKAVEYGAEVNDYWAAQAREGKCSMPELLLSDAGTGIWMVKGDIDVLRKIHDTEEARMLTLKGDLLLEDFRLEFYYAGDAAADHMLRYTSALSAIG